MKTNKHIVRHMYGVLVGFAVLLCTGCSFGNRYLVNDYDVVTLYSEENENSAVVGTLAPGERVLVISEGWDKWAKVEYYGVEAYLNRNNTRTGTKLVDENGDLVWMTRSILKPIGIAIGVLLGIALAFGVIALLAAGISYLIGLLWRLFCVYVVAGAGLGWLIGYAITKNIDDTFMFIKIGAALGLVIGIIRIVMHPSREADAGLDDAAKTARNIKQQQAKREADIAKDYPYKLSDGTPVRRDVGGGWIDQKGKHYD